MPDRTRRSISLRGETRDALRDRAAMLGTTASAIVTGIIERHTPPIVAVPQGEAMDCTGCHRATVHHLAYIGRDLERWRCGVCNRSKLVERAS